MFLLFTLYYSTQMTPWFDEKNAISLRLLCYKTVILSFHHCTESQQSASRGRVLAFYRIAPCLTNVPRSRQTDTSPANRASPAHVRSVSRRIENKPHMVEAFGGWNLCPSGRLRQKKWTIWPQTFLKNRNGEESEQISLALSFFRWS